METGAATSEIPNDARLFQILRFLFWRYQDNAEKYFSVTTVMKEVQRMMNRSLRFSDVKSCIIHLGKIELVEVIEAEGGYRCKLSENGYGYWKSHGAAISLLLLGRQT